jgi:hypothetical protein
MKRMISRRPGGPVRAACPWLGAGLS